MLQRSRVGIHKDDRYGWLVSVQKRDQTAVCVLGLKSPLTKQAALDAAFGVIAGMRFARLSPEPGVHEW